MTVPFPHGAEKYQSFRESILRVSPVVREPVTPVIPEMDLQAMWFGGEFGRSYSGTEGEQIEILQFGHWNHSAGPDFTETAISINGEIRKGSIEIEIDSTSWEQHGHGSNPAFDDVVLHVFLHDSRQKFYTRNSRHESIPQIKLDQEALGNATVRDLPEAFPGRCLAPLSEMTDEAVESLIESAAQFRAMRKFDRLKAMAESTSARQTIFQAICEALGFRHNKTAMAVLAQRNPLSDLLALQPAEREARLFGTAGFMETESYDPSLSSDATDYLKKLWAHWWKIRPALEPEIEYREIRWKLSGTRPLNHPQRRVGAIAAILKRWNYLTVVWERPGEDLEKKWQTRCDELEHDYWQNHYTLSSKASKNPMKLIGTDRQRDILGNVIFPWSLGRHEELWPVFMEMKGVDSNEKLRRAQLRLFGSDSERAGQFAKKYFQQQALLQIYHDFCLEDSSDCQNCPFPEQVAQWS